MNQLTISYCSQKIIEHMRTKRYSDSTIKQYQKYFNDFENYCKEKRLVYYEEMTAIEYATAITGIELIDLATPKKGKLKFQYILRALRLLGEYSRTQTFTSRMSRFHEPVDEHPYWNGLYDKFMNYLNFECDYAESTIVSKELTIRLVLNILIQRKINHLDEINQQIIEMVVTQFIHEASKSVTHRIGNMKQFFQYCFDNELSKINICHLIPAISTPHETKIQASWTAEEAKQLLDSIDRSSEIGKRDYAILLLASRLGLRAIDLANLELSDFDWSTHVVTIRQKKTRNTITLPLLSDIGWAVIDYIKVRPVTDEKKLFISAKPPYEALITSSSFVSIFVKRMHQAGLRVKNADKCGIHSLRHTLGGLLLEKETPLPVISQILGHKSIQSTETYLRINMAGLNECPIDPDEVFHDEL